MKFKSGFSRIPGHQVFQYRFRYAKEEGKEEQDQRFMLSERKFLEKDRNSFAAEFKRNSKLYRKQETKNSRTRLLAVVAIITIIVIFLLHNF